MKVQSNLKSDYKLYKCIIFLECMVSCRRLKQSQEQQSELLEPSTVYQGGIVILLMGLSGTQLWQIQQQGISIILYSNIIYNISLFDLIFHQPSSHKQIRTPIEIEIFQISSYVQFYVAYKQHALFIIKGTPF